MLVGLANHAGPDGTVAFPSVATLVRYTGLAERTVRTCLDRLAAAGIIAPCDPGIVAARIKRADRRPQGWDLIPYGSWPCQVVAGEFADCCLLGRGAGTLVWPVGGWPTGGLLTCGGAG